MVRVKITLPDSNVAWAVVEEDGNLGITIGEQHFIFSPRIINLEAKSVVIENIYNSSNESTDDFHFEIIDAFSSPISDIKQQKDDCENGNCCLTCGTTTVCANCVAMCKEKCCCRLACCIEL